MDGQELVQLASRALHILGAIVLAGGLFYIRSVLSPSGVDACFAGRRAVWAKWVGIATFLLLGTGIYNFFAIKNQVEADGGELVKNYNMLFGIKFLLGLVVMFIAAILSGKTSLAEKFRANMGRWLNFAWFAVVAIVVLAAMLRTLH
jgi:uncharacterized membrane protein